MKASALPLALACGLAWWLVACGDSGSDGQGGSGGGATSSSTAKSSSNSGSSSSGPPAGSCAQPGDMGNEIGVGEYCTPLGGQCKDNSAAQLCLADVGQDQWMCTRIGCDEMTDCGAGAGCLIVQGEGSACVPCECESAGVGCTGSSSASSGASSSSSSSSSTSGGG